MSSRAASLAKTSALQESKPELVKAQDQGFGPRLSDLLASYDRNSSSWRTSQTCLLAQAESLADGLAEFSETWPNAGMMRNGEIYRRAWSVPPTGGNASGSWPTPRNCTAMAATITPESAWAEGRFPNLETMVGRSLWPTPQKSDNRDRGNLSSPSVQRRKRIGKQLGLSQVVSDQSGALNPPWVEWLMGFPLGWTDLAPSATP